MKYLQNKQSFLKDYKSVNEKFDMSASGGPGANDINWGDSLVGRLINSFRRKIGIGTNLVRIGQVLKQLKRNFDEIEYYSQANALSDDQKRNAINCMIYEFVGIIETAIMQQKNKGFASEGEGGALAEEETGSDAGSKKPTNIEDKNYLNEIREMILDGITHIKEKSTLGYKADNEDKIISILEDLAEEIKRMQDDFSKDSDKEEEKSEEGEEKSEEGKLNPNYNNNFKSVAQIIIEYDKMKKSSKKDIPVKKSETDTKEEENEEQKKTQVPNKLKKVPVPAQFEDEKQLELPFPQKETEEVKESYIFEAVESPILMPLKKLYSTFIQIEPDVVSDMQSYLKMSEKNQLDGIQKSIINGISSVYTYILKKQGVNEKYLIKEDLNVLLSRDSKIGDVIISLYNVSKQKTDGSFEGISEGMQKALASFNSTMLECLSPKKKDKYEPQEEEENKNVSRFVDSKSTKLHRYLSFIKEELDFDTKDPDFGKDVSVDDSSKWKAVDSDGKEYTESKVNIETQKPILKHYWKSIWTKELVKLVLTEKEANKLNSDFQALEIKKDNQEEALTIKDGKDPIIGILRCFNRAYKLHTTQVIPSGRSGGKVSNKTFREYTAFGSNTSTSTDGSLQGGPGGGPYRNNAIYNKWESGVMDIIEDRKYQPIFDKNTKLQIGDKIKEGAGPILKKMITDLLDGDTLYKSSERGSKDSGGVQKEFLDKYFGDLNITKDFREEEVFFGGKDDMEATQAAADGTPDPITLSFENLNNIKAVVGSIFKIENGMSSTTNGWPKYMYFYIQDLIENNVIIVYSYNFGTFGNYIQNSADSKKPPVTYKFGDLKGSPFSDIYITKMSKDTLTDIINKKSKKLNAKPYKSEDKISLKEIDVQAKEINFLFQEEKGEKSLFKLDNENLTRGIKVIHFGNDEYSKAPKTT